MLPDWPFTNTGANVGSDRVDSASCRGQRRRRARGVYPYVLIGVLFGMLSGWIGCSDGLVDESRTLGDTRERVEANLLPPLLAESSEVLRNILNLMPLFTEICATPVGELGDFVSTMPELQRAQQLVGDRFQIDDLDGSWRASWRDVVLGDADGQVPPGVVASPIDITLTIRARTEEFRTVQALPFFVAGQDAVDLSREPAIAPACGAETSEGFYLFQDAASGVWTLSWCTEGEAKTVAGEISAPTLSRVVRRLADDAPHEVSSLDINSVGTQVTFRETAVPGETNGFRFFVRPGEAVRFELSLGAAGADTISITPDQIVLGSGLTLPGNLEAGNFRLFSSLPIVPIGAPAFTPGADLGVFIWRDDANNQCLEAGAEQWRLRLSTPGSTLFSASVRTQNENVDSRIGATAVGVCPAPSIEDNTTRVRFECQVMDATPSGYDICVTNSERIVFAPEVEDVLDPSLVRIGSMGQRPSAEDAFTILFELEGEEQTSAQNLRFEQSQLVLHGSVNEDVRLDTALRADQVSRDPLCQAPVALTDIQFRLTGQGEYLTERFEGSLYEMDDVEYTNGGVTTVERARFPDAGRVILGTREEQEPVEIIVPMADVRAESTGTVGLIDVDLQIDTIQFFFLDRPVNLTFE